MATAIATPPRTGTRSQTLEPIVISGDRCRDWGQSSALEWLETNGAGGFAMGTVSGANTRRYHGILTASLRPPVERQVLLSRVEEEVLIDGATYNLGAAQYPGVLTPSGFQLLEQFRLDPFPVWTYSAGPARIEKSLFLRQGEQTAVLVYRSDTRCRFRIRSFLSCRDYHSLRHANGALDNGPLQLHANHAGFVSVGHWYHNNEYKAEIERGLDFREDLWSPGWMDFELGPDQPAFLVATIEPGPRPELAAVIAWERAERERRLQSTDRLQDAAAQFVVLRADGSPTIIAGYPWFTDWGRDTMISIPGLLLTHGRLREAEHMLAGFLRHLDRGLIPNRFPDSGEQPEYNTADATLWAFAVAWDLETRGQSASFLRETFYPAAKEILDWHRRGTHHGIQVDPADGLLAAGTEGTQLTWMDAKVGDWVVTPRHGKAVEINALWYNALRMTAWWARRYRDLPLATALDAEAQRLLRSFESAFWDEERGCLRDLAYSPDRSIRPNQLFAISLPFPLLDGRRQQRVVEVVERELLTPFGLRTLAPGDPDYQPRYEGGPRERDGAYHRGTVWPWLIGPYVGARLTAFGMTPENRAHCRQLLDRLSAAIGHGCLGTIGELYDGDEPRRPVGAPAQAWSVAELLRAREMVG